MQNFSILLLLSFASFFEMMKKFFSPHSSCSVGLCASRNSIKKSSMEETFQFAETLFSFCVHLLLLTREERIKRVNLKKSSSLSSGSRAKFYF
jgi:hypothetical protein